MTIGMATYEDFDGPYFTIQSLRAHHNLTGCELVLVDNSPAGSRVSTRLKNFCESWAKARYFAMPESQGTTQPRQRIFDEAGGEWVLVLDSHVLLMPGALDSLARYCRRHSNSQDILSGPILYDDLKTICGTEFRDEWRGGMWGVWHTDERGTNPNADPYEIWGQGLGLFCMRRAAFPGFDRRWRGFGGEEGVIHEQVRKAGGRAVCLPWLRWGHRFSDPQDVKYPAPVWQKVRNYVLGFQSLGRDVEPIRRHFVDETKAMRAAMWAALIANPERETEPGVEGYRRVSPFSTPPAATPQRPSRPSVFPQPTNPRSIDDVFEFCRATPRDLDQHFDALKGYAAKCGVVVELTKRRESTVALLAGRPQVLETFTTESDAIHDTLHWIVSATNPLPIQQVSTHVIRDTLDASLVVPECDLLYVDSVHHEDRIFAELERYGPRVKRYLAIRGTAAFGEIAEGGDGRGLYFGVERWLERDREQSGREWVRVFRSDRQYGLSVYSCDADAVSVDVGPGTELAVMLRQMGIASGPSCSCRARKAVMDQLGVSGCRERLHEIAGWLRDGAPQWHWTEKLKAAVSAAKLGFAHRLNPLDPYPGLVTVAIERAEATIARNEAITAKERRAA